MVENTGTDPVTSRKPRDLLFVVNVADFWYVVVENRLSNSKLHY